MTSGRVITEHDVTAERWYLDAGRIPTCVAVEAGQADLFLSGYLGIDFITKGLAVYRLLDAEVTFHRSLPTVGETIRYDIHIDHFFRQDQTYLFRFHFEGTVNGEPLLSMKKGCAGFFSAAELAAGQGDRPDQTRPACRKPGIRPADWRELAPLSGIESLQRRPDRRSAPRAIWPAASARPSPSCRFSDPTPCRKGCSSWSTGWSSSTRPAAVSASALIRAEADIHSDDWFLTSHFCDDHVMPGTLMYECCLHTLRIYLLRMGWVGESGERGLRAGSRRGKPAQVPRPGDRDDPHRDLRGDDQGARLSPRAVRHRRCPDVRRRQADRRDRRHDRALDGVEPGDGGRAVAGTVTARRGCPYWHRTGGRVAQTGAEFRPTNRSTVPQYRDSPEDQPSTTTSASSPSPSAILPRPLASPTKSSTASARSPVCRDRPSSSSTASSPSTARRGC